MNAAHEALTNHRTHRAAHECKLKCRGDEWDRVDRPSHHNQGVGLTCLFHRLFETIRIFTTIAKFQRIDGNHFLADLKAPFGIEQQVKAGSCRDP